MLIGKSYLLNEAYNSKVYSLHDLRLYHRTLALSEINASKEEPCCSPQNTTNLKCRYP
ncbi:MAG: hypothetical protein SGJ04_06760 [Bacteroidota bacterium]|nr:hypothetical protein [Bacteroidota bacterium]